MSPTEAITLAQQLLEKHPTIEDVALALMQAYNKGELTGARDMGEIINNALA